MTDGKDAAPAEGAASTLKTYTLDEVAKHNTSKDVWIAVNGKVYDVTSFLDNHPGGPEMILQHAGQDATSDFESIHSPSAHKMLAEYLIGQLPEGAGKRSDSGSGAKHGGSGISYLGPIIALAFAVWYHFFGGADTIKQLTQ